MNESDAKSGTFGHIDSATVHELILLFHHQKWQDGLPWSWRGSIETTLALIDTDQLRLSPGTGTLITRATPYERLEGNLEKLGLVSSQKEPAGWSESALKATKTWAIENVPKLKDICVAMKSESMDWLEEDRLRTWENHRDYPIAVFDEQFIAQLAAIRDMSERDVRQLWERTADPKVIANYVNASNAKSGDLAVVHDLYLLSCLLRGRYHDEIARLSGSQILHHTFRAPLFEKSAFAAPLLDVLPAKFYLALIIVADAFAARTIEKRIERWSENVGLARAGLRNGVAAEEFDDDEKARQAAVEAAFELGIGARTATLSVLENGLSIIISGATGMWSSAAVDHLGLSVASPEGQFLNGSMRGGFERGIGPVKKKIVDTYRRWRLSDLSRVWPGRITRTWRKPDI
jgi:hypothetical protein